MVGCVEWQTEDRCTVSGTVFQTIPVQLLRQERPSVSMKGADFWLFKERPLVDRYVALVGELRPRKVLELGIFQGGSTAFFLELARPEVLVAIDERPPRGPALRAYLERRPHDGCLRVHDDVDQADRSRLAEIVSDTFGDEPLDLVTDDCSHLYEPTRASFNELFPRLRPGGVYVIEDWRWVAPGPADADRIPLSRLILEITLVLASRRDVIADIRIGPDAVEIRRGDGPATAGDFDVSAQPDVHGANLARP